MIRIAIAEDEPEQAQLLEQYIQDYGRESGLSFKVTVYSNGEDLVEQYKSQFDLLLLDVEMPFIDGMTAAKQIRRVDPEVIIIFITNLAQYAIMGYEVSALDYILKPVSYFSFAQHLGRAVASLRREANRFLSVAIVGGTVKLDTGRIFYMERQGYHLVIHTKTDIYISPSTIQQMEQALEGQGFFRCNKGCLVNLALVEGVRDGCALIHGEQLPISRSRKAPFMAALADYLGRVIT